MTSVIGSAAPALHLQNISFSAAADNTPNPGVVPPASAVSTTDSQDQTNAVQNQPSQNPISFTPVDTSNETSNDQTQSQTSSLPALTFTAVNPDSQTLPVSAYNALAQASSSTILGANINIQA